MTTLSIGLLVPCRNEAAVVGRKLANASALRWPGPAARGPHRVVVVDDGSDDETAARAERAFAAFERTGVEPELVANDVRPGKAGALEAGLARLVGRVDVVVLSDADVVLAEDALAELAAAFERDAELGMASGGQVFVEALADDGTTRAPGGAPVRPAAGLFDRVTARVRGLESRWGRLFSVHGQLLAWRAELELAPTAGVAADDIDLALQVRARGKRVALVPTARFFEVKTAREPETGGVRWEDQALRRARAYVQVVRHHRRPLRGHLVDELQWLFYRYVPLLAPELAAAALFVLPLAAWTLAGPTAGGVTALILVGLCLTPVGLRGLRLLGVIARATRLERRSAMADRWEMGRT